MSTAIESLLAKIETVTAGVEGIETVHLGYIHELATGQVDFTAMLVLPPKANIPSHRLWNHKEYELRYFLISLDEGSEGGQMTPDERVTEWGRLDGLNRDFIVGLASDPSKYQLSSGIVVDYNSGGRDGLLPDSVIWIEVSFKIKVYDCAT